MHLLWAGKNHETSPGKYAYTDNFVLNRKSTSKNISVRLTAGIIAIIMAVGVVAVFDTDVAPTPAQAAPGTPGVPKSGTVLFEEDFENKQTRVPLNEYVGSPTYNSQKYTSDRAWSTQHGGCNGWVLNAESATPSSSQDPGCASGTSGAWGSLQGLSQVLGLAQGQTGEEAGKNFALSEYTNKQNSQSAGVMIKSGPSIATATPKHFYSVSAFFAATSCISTPSSTPQLSFYLLIGGEPMQLASGLDPCKSAIDGYDPMYGGSYGGKTNVWIAPLYSSAIKIDTNAGLGFQLNNTNNRDLGNDAAFDLPQIMDVTPQLDQTFVPPVVQLGTTTQLTYTITNTTDLQAKKGWSFAALLPGWVMTALNGDPETTCDQGSVTLDATGNLKASGNLNDGQTSCTVTVPVLVGEHGTYDVADTVVKDLDGLLPPGQGSMTTTELVLDATATPVSTFEVGEQIDYTFTVKNAGRVSLTNVRIDAPARYTTPGGPGFSGTNTWDITCDATRLAPDASTTCHAPYTVNEQDVEAGQIRLSAVARAIAAGATEDTKSNPATIDVRTNTPVVPHPSADNSDLEVSPLNQTVGGNVVAKATIRDLKDLPLIEQEVTITLSGDATFGKTDEPRLGTKTCLTDADGVCEIGFTDPTAQIIEVRASVTDEGSSSEIRGSGVEVRFTSGTADPKRSTLEVDRSTQKAGEPVVATVTARDSFGNLVDDQTVSLTVSGTATFARVGDPRVGETTCVTQEGACEVTFTDHRVGEVTLRAMIEGTGVGNDQDPAKASPQRVSFTASDPVTGPVTCLDPDKMGTNLFVDVNELNVGETSTATALVTDKFCNPVADVHLDFSIDPGTKAVLNPHQSITDEQGNAYATVTDRAPETVKVRAQLNSEDLDGSPQPVRFLIGDVDDANSSVQVSDPVQTVGVLVTVTVIVRDGHDNPISGLRSSDITVQGVSEDRPDLEMKNFAETTPGTYTYTTTSKLVGDFEISAVVNKVSLSMMPHARFIAGGVCVTSCQPVDRDNVTRFEMVDNGRTADGVSYNSAQAFAFDTYGNVVEGARVVVDDQTIGVLAGALKPATQEKTTDSYGTAMVYWTSTKPGTYTAVGTIGGLDPATRVMDKIHFVTGAADPSTSEMRVSPASPLVVGSSYTVDVTIRDRAGNPVADQMVFFTLNPDTPAEVSDDTCVTNTQGICTVQVTSKLVTRVAIHATIGDDRVGLGGNGDPFNASPQHVEFVAGMVCVIDCNPVNVDNVTRVKVIFDGAEANGAASDLAQVFAYDRFGNPVEGALVTSNAKNVTVMPIAKTMNNGTTLIEYRSTKAGTHLANVWVAGQTPSKAISSDGTETTDGSISISFASGTADPNHSTLSIDPDRSQVVGSIFMVTAHVYDVNDNPVENAIVVFPEVSKLSFANGTSCTSGPDGTCQVMVSSKLVGTYTISGRIGARPLVNTVNAEFTAGPVCVQDCDPVEGANVTRVVVTLNGSRADGVQPDVADAYAYDYYGNPVVGADVRSVPAAGETALTVQSDIEPIDSNGHTTIWYTSTVKGPHLADVWITELIPEGSPIILRFGNGSGPTATSSWVIAPTGPLTVGQDEENRYVATVTVRDVTSNAVPEAVVSFGVDPAGPWFAPEATCTTNDDGVCSVDLFSTKSGTYTVSASITAGGITNETTGQLTASVAWRADAVCSAADGCDPVDPGLADELRTRVEVSVDNQIADGNARDIVTVWAFDKYGNPVDGARVTSSAQSEDLGVQEGITPIGTDGSSTVWYTSRVARTHSADVAVDDVVPVASPVDLSFRAGPVCVAEAGCDPATPDKLTRVEVTRDGQSVDADPDVVTAYAFDKQGNAVRAVSFDFANISGDDLVIDPACVTGEDGTCEAEARAWTAGSHSATASVEGAELTEHGSPVTLNFVAGEVCVVEAGCVPVGHGTNPAQQTHAVVTKNDQPVLGQDIVTIFAFDVYGNPVDEVPFVFTTPHQDLLLGGRTRLAQAVVTSDEEGTGELASTSFYGGAYQARTFVGGVELAGHGSPLELRFLDKPVITSPGEGELTKDKPVTITGLGQNPGDNIIVTEDGQRVCSAVVRENGTWSCAAEFADGPHVIRAVEITDGGQESTPSELRTFVVDTAAPTPPEITAPGPGAVIPDPGPEIIGIGFEEGGTITVTEGGQPVCTAVVQAGLSWSCAPLAPFVDGEHQVVAKETDEAGNTSDPSDPRTFIVDTKPPAPPTVEPSTGGVITGTAEPGTDVTVIDPEGEIIPGCEAIHTDESGRFTCTPPVPFTPGDKVTAVAVDKAGNTSGPGEVTIGTIFVELAHPARLPGEDQTATGLHFIPGETVCLSLDSGEVVECKKADVDGTVSFVFPAPSADGSHMVTLTGEVSGTVSTTFDTIILVKTGGRVQVRASAWDLVIGSFREVFLLPSTLRGSLGPSPSLTAWVRVSPAGTCE